MIQSSRPSAALLGPVALLFAAGGLAACAAHAQTTAKDAPPVSYPERLNRDVRPIGSPDDWFTDKDYPSKSKRQGAEGSVTYTLTIDTNGRANVCSILASSGHADLDAAVCPILMRRGRFEPKVVDGKAVQSVYHSWHSWVIPEKGGPAPARQSAAKSIGPSYPLKPIGRPASWFPQSAYPNLAWNKGRSGTVGYSLTVGTNGVPTSCRITSSSGHPDLDAATCHGAMMRAQFAAEIENGKTVPSTYSGQHIWAIPQ